MEQKSSGQKRRKYDAFFKEKVLKMVLNGRPVPEIAQSLGIGENLIYKWKSRSHQPPATTGVSHAATSSAALVGLEDYQALHKRIRELETERGILKKALVIFSRPA